MTDDLVLKAFAIHGEEIDGLEIVPAHPQREWMNQTKMEHQHSQDKIEIGLANRCLPLLMANQVGWNVVSKVAFMATSDPDTGMMLFHWKQPPPKHGEPRNNFKENLLTWPMPWTFETPPGWDLMLLPPPNIWLPDGAHGLAALVETDHVPASFTYNWYVQPGRSIWVKPGDIVCRLLPYQTGELERFRFEEILQRQEGYNEWLADRTEAMNRAIKPKGVWEKSYFKVAKRLKLKRR